MGGWCPLLPCLAAPCYLPSQIHLGKQQLQSPLPGLLNATSFQGYFPGLAWPLFDLPLTTGTADPT